MLITGFHKNNFIQFGHRLTEDDLYNDKKLDKFDEKNKKQNITTPQALTYSVLSPHILCSQGAPFARFCLQVKSGV